MDMQANVNFAAPDFALKDQNDKEIKLSDFIGKKVLLAFYPFDWSPVCTVEMKCYNQDMTELENLGIQVIGVSVDSVWSHKAFAASLGIDFPLLSDFSKETVRKYGLLKEEGFSERAYFLVNEAGIITWKHVMPSPGQRLENKAIMAAIKETGD